MKTPFSIFSPSSSKVFDSCTCLGNHLIILKWTKQKRWWVCWSLLHSMKGMGIYKKTSYHQRKEPFLDPLQSSHVKMCLCVCHCFATALKYKVTGFYEIWIRILLNNLKKSHFLRIFSDLYYWAYLFSKHFLNAHKVSSAMIGAAKTEVFWTTFALPSESSQSHAQLSLSMMRSVIKVYWKHNRVQWSGFQG